MEIDKYLALRGEIKKQMTIKNIRTYQQLADMTGLARATVAGFMTGTRYSDLVDKKLRDVLDIPEHLAS